MRATSDAYASELAPSESNIRNSLDRIEEDESLSLDQIIASIFSVVDNDVAQVSERAEREDDSVRAYSVYLSFLNSFVLFICWEQILEVENGDEMLHELQISLLNRCEGSLEHSISLSRIEPSIDGVSPTSSRKRCRDETDSELVSCP